MSTKGVAWHHHETSALLDIWADPEIQRQLSSRLHNMCVYEGISNKLADLGVHRSGEQCREKIKKLRRDYNTVTSKNYAPTLARKVIGCYDKVDRIFGDRVARKQSRIVCNKNFDAEKAKKRDGVTNKEKKVSKNYGSPSNGNMSVLRDEITNTIITKHALSLDKLQSQQTIMHNRFIEFEKERFHKEMARQREKLSAIETQRQHEREQQVKLLTMILKIK